MRIKINVPESNRELPPQVQALLGMVKGLLPSREAVQAYAKKVSLASMTQSEAEVRAMMMQDTMTAVAGYLPLLAGLAGQAVTVLPALQAGIEYLSSQPEETQPALRAWVLSKGGAKIYPQLAIEFGMTLTSADDPESAVAELDEIMAQVVAAHAAAVEALAADERREPALRAFSAEQDAENTETAYWSNFFGFGQAIATAEGDEETLAAVNARFEQLIEQYGQEEEDVDLEPQAFPIDDLFSAMLNS